MKKITALVLSMIMVCSLLAGCGGSSPATDSAVNNDTAKDSGDAGEPIVIRLAHCNPEGDPTDLEAKKFKELAEEYTDGAVTIDIYPNSILGDWTELLEGLSLGVCEMMIEGYSDLERYSQVAALDAVPFVYEDYDHFMNVWHGDVGKEMAAAVLEDSGIHIFGGCYRGARIVTSTKPFTSADELADLGLKIRVPSVDIYVKTWEALQTSPTPMNLNEVLTGLQQGTVEAQENPCIMSYNYGFYDVCDYVVKTEHVNSATVFMTADNWFSTLSPELQEQLMQAAEDASLYACELVRDMESEYYDKFEEKGVTILDVDKQSFVDATANVVSENYPDLLSWVEKIKAAA